MLAQTDRFNLRIALVAKRPVLVANEAAVGQLLVAQLTAEARRMPAGRHCLDDASNHEFTALVAARRKQDVEIAFAVLATLELVEDTILKGAKALRTSISRWLYWIRHLLVRPVTYTKHCVCHSSPFELTIFSCGSKPSSQREQNMLPSDILPAKLYAEKRNGNNKPISNNALDTK